MLMFLFNFPFLKMVTTEVEPAPFTEKGLNHAFPLFWVDTFNGKIMGGRKYSNIIKRLRICKCKTPPCSQIQPQEYPVTSPKSKPQGPAWEDLQWVPGLLWKHLAELLCSCVPECAQSSKGAGRWWCPWNSELFVILPDSLLRVWH